MNNGVNETNNFNNQNTTLEPVLQPITNTDTPVLQPVQPVATPAISPVVSQVQAPVMNTIVAEGDNIQPVESGEVIQSIPGVIVAPPQQGGTVKPNPVQTLSEEVKEEVKEEVAQETVVDTNNQNNDTNNINGNGIKKNTLTKILLFIVIVLIGVITSIFSCLRQRNFILVLLYKSPSGLLLYWTCNNLYSLIKNVFMKALKIKEKEIKINNQF